MKAIDLLNKIANGEETPEKIKVFGGIYYLCKNDCSRQLYFSEKQGCGGIGLKFDTSQINDEVEIIEEDKKIPKKIEEEEIEVSMAIGEQICANKINEIKEILDKLKKLCYDDYCLEFSVDYIERKEEKLLLDYITNLQEKNERLKNGYCELKVKCNNGECDCTNEEYDGMVQANMKNYLLLEDYKLRIDKAIEILKKMKHAQHLFGGVEPTNVDKVLNILQGEDTNVKDKR